MRVDSYELLDVTGLIPADAMAKMVEHLNEVTVFIVKLNKEIEDLKRKVIDLELQNANLQSQIRR